MPDDQEDPPDIDPFCSNCGVIWVGDEDLCEDCFRGLAMPVE